MGQRLTAPDRRRAITRIVAVRYVLPAVLLVAGVVLFIVDSSLSGLDGLVMLTAAGLSVLLLNVLYRVGVSGDAERDREEEARDYFDAHGAWPEEEDDAPHGRRWTLAPGVETAEPEEEE